MTHSDSSLKTTSKSNGLSRLLREYQWLIFGSLWISSLALGTLGFALHAEANQISSTFWDHLYRALQLITMNSGAVEGAVNWQLEVARFFIPILTAATAIQAFASIFRTQIQLIRLSRLSGHIVICGLSKKGIRLVRGYRAQGKAVVAIERDEGNDYIEQCRSEGAIILLGDATDTNLLLKAGVQRASLLISVCDDDGTNAEVALRTRQITAQHRKDPLTCVIHLVDPQLCMLLREREISTEQDVPFRLEFFNVFEHAARLLLAQYSPFSAGIKANRPPHLVIIGLGKMGESLVIHAARQWREQYHSRRQQRLRITVIDLSATAKCESLSVRYPQLVNTCDISPLQINIHSAEFERAAFLYDENRKICADAIYINIDDDSLGLHAGLMINQRMRNSKTPIVIRMAEDNGLASLLHQGASHNGFDNLHEFSVLDQTCTPELVSGGTHEILARALHEEYMRSQHAAGQSIQSNSLLVSWDELNPAIKESNYRQADHIGVKLKAVNRGIAPLTDWSIKKDEFSTEEIERLAQMEHERWCSELRRDGWRFSPGMKDHDNLTHPDLVEWSELPEEEKEKNRVAVVEIPFLLARAGLQVFRLD